MLNISCTTLSTCAQKLLATPCDAELQLSLFMMIWLTGSQLHFDAIVHHHRSTVMLNVGLKKIKIKVFENICHYYTFIKPKILNHGKLRTICAWIFKYIKTDRFLGIKTLPSKSKRIGPTQNMEKIEIKKSITIENSTNTW